MRTFELLLLASAFTTGLMMKRGEGMWLSVFGGVGLALLLDQLLSTKGNVSFEAPVGVNTAALQGA